MTRVVVLGGGIGGLEVIRTLQPKDLELVLVTERDYYISGPSRPLILSNEQSVDRITRGYGYLPENVEIIHRKAISVNPRERKVLLSDGSTLEYGYLVISTGLYYDYGSIGTNRIFNAYDLGKLFDLKNLLWNVKEGTFLVYAPKQPYRCAPAPAETALTIDMVLRHRGARERINILFVDANPKVQPPVIHDVWTKRFEEAGIEYILGKEIVEVRRGEIELNDGDVIKVDYPVILPPNRARNLLDGSKSFIEVRSPYDLRSVEYDDIFVVGDVAKLPFPKNSEITSTSARIASLQILEELGEDVPEKPGYRFVGWAYAGNLTGELSTESIRFELEFTSEGPKGSKDPEPKKEYTKQKDVWEQAVLKKLFGY